jgi:N-sulfoglucosamine sulfohydrolase
MLRFLLPACLLFTSLAFSAEPAKRPNILFCIGDDISWPHMSAYGCKFVKTPNFDRVAREGVLFQNAFTVNPKCSPSRAALLTGKQSFQLEEAADHFGIFPAKWRVYPDLLEEVGYHVGFTGKGWGPGDWQRGGFTRNPAGPEYAKNKLKPPTTGISPKDYAKNFEDFLKDRKPGQPFCFWYGGHEPHRGYEPGSGLKGGKKLEDVEVPACLPDDPIVRSDLLDYALEIEWFDTQLGLMLKTLEDLGELDNTLVVVTADNGMPFPRIKGNPYEMGQHLPLAMRWGARAKAGRTVEDLVSSIDMAPTYLEAAGLPVHPQMVGHSLVPVLTSEKSGIVDPQRNFVVSMKERHDIGREGDVGYPIRTLRTPDFLYIHNFKPERPPAGLAETGFREIDDSPTKSLELEQHEKGPSKFYDLAFGQRPEEELYRVGDLASTDNLANDPHYAETKKALWEQLQTYLKANGDPRILGQGDVFDHYEYVGARDKGGKNKGGAN